MLKDDNDMNDYIILRELHEIYDGRYEITIKKMDKKVGSSSRTNLHNVPSMGS